jgi:hypothetical protein
MNIFIKHFVAVAVALFLVGYTFSSQCDGQSQPDAVPDFVGGPLRSPYDNAKPPSLSLPAAYELAATALGSATNQLHCVSATTDRYYSDAGEWFFTFCGTNKPPQFRYVSVEFGGKVHAQALPPGRRPTL